MAKGRLIKDLFQKIGVFGAQASATPKPSVQGTPDIRQFQKQLDDTLERHPEVGGHLFMLDLHSLKTAMGAEWTKASKSIHNKVEDIIDRHLAEFELKVKKDDESYMVLFPSLSVEEGEMKALVIAAEITNALLGSKAEKGPVTVKMMSMSATGRLQSKQAPSLNSLTQRMATRLVNIPQQKTESAPVYGRVSPKKPLPEDMPQSGDTDKVEFDFVFRPLLSVKSKIISTFLCVPIREISDGHYLSGYDVAAASGQLHQVSSLDLAVCERIADELRVVVASNKRSLLGIPVHFKTLSDPNHRSAYLSRCHANFKNDKNRLVFELVGLPDGVPEARLFEITAQLKPTSRSVIARLSPNHKRFLNYKESGLHAVGLDVYNSRRSETEMLRLMDAFARNAQDARLKTYISGVRSLSLFSAAIASGFDYVAGYALSSAVPTAQDISQFRLDQIYMSFLRDYGLLGASNPNRPSDSDPTTDDEDGD